jgi:glycosyltransferase involved in cell wall biosynthesis
MSANYNKALIHVSVIITVYNQELTLARTIDSVLNQHCSFNFEIVIADDFSTDNSRKIAKEYALKFPNIVRLSFLESNFGVGSNWALAVQSAKSEFITTCAADDFWHNNDKLAIQVDYMHSNNNCGILYTDYDLFDTNKNKVINQYLKTNKVNCLTGPGLLKFVFTGKLPILTVTTIFRKFLFDSYIPVDDYVKYRFLLEDWPTWLILSKYTEIHYLPISTATYVTGHDSISNPLSYAKAEKKFDSEHLMYKYLCNMFPEDINYVENHYLSYRFIVLLNMSYKKGDFFKAKFYSNKMLEIGFSNFKSKMARFYFTFYFTRFVLLLKNYKTTF